MNGQRYHGFFDDWVHPSQNGSFESNQTLFTPIVEDGNVIAFTLTYSTGETQTLWIVSVETPLIKVLNCD